MNRPCLILVTWLVLWLTGCAPDRALVDAAFCDESESCAGPAPEDFECGNGRCVDLIHNGQCVAVFACTEEDKCIGVERKPGYMDEPCIVNTCEGWEWHSREYTAAELDDGDPCTLDYCDPTFGPKHYPSCF